MKVTCRRLNRVMPFWLFVLGVLTTEPPWWLIVAAAFALVAAFVVMDYAFDGSTHEEEL